MKQYADEDIRRLEVVRQQQRQQANDDAVTLGELHIDYELPFVSHPDKEAYAVAFNEINEMLNGTKPLSIERAVFLSEYAFDRSLKFSEFDQQLNKAATVIGLQMEKDKISPRDNLGKIMTTFRFMSDTLSVTTKLEGSITTYPKTYDFEDFWGKQNYKKMFVSKTLREGTGQCHSLPLLFLLLCEKTNADAHLAFAPNHSFIKFQDKHGKWHNIELTNGMLASDHFMIESGYIKAEAMQNRIYLEPLSKKQVIMQCLNDLALGYQKRYGYDVFVKECANTVIGYDAKNLTARQLLANYYNNLAVYIIRQYQNKKLTKAAFDEDKQAQDAVQKAQHANEYIDNLGYADMPEKVYNDWLNSIQKEISKQQHANEVKVLGGMIEIKK